MKTLKQGEMAKLRYIHMYLASKIFDSRPTGSARSRIMLVNSKLEE